MKTKIEGVTLLPAHKAAALTAWKAKSSTKIILVAGRLPWMEPAVTIIDLELYLSKSHSKEELITVLKILGVGEEWWELKETKMVEHLFVPTRDIPGWEDMPTEKKVEILKERIKTGNIKLNTAWNQIHDSYTDQIEREVVLEKWSEATHKLQEMRDQIRIWGFTGCLYAGADGHPTISCLDGFEPLGCMACPSDFPYWEEYFWGKGGKPKALPATITKTAVEADTEMMALPVFDPKASYFKGIRLREFADGKWQIKEM